MDIRFMLRKTRSLAVFVLCGTSLWVTQQEACAKPPYDHPNALVAIVRDVDVPAGAFAAVVDVHALNVWQTAPNMSPTQVFSNSASVNLTTATGKNYDLTEMFVSDGLFDVLGVKNLVGRTLRPGDGELRPLPAVLSYRGWHNWFGGSPAAIGQVLRGGDSDCVIVGVMPSSFEFPATSPDMWTSLHVTTPGPEGPRKQNVMMALARLGPGATRRQISTVVNSTFWRVQRDYYGLDNGPPRGRVTLNPELLPKMATVVPLSDVIPPHRHDGVMIAAMGSFVLSLASLGWRRGHGLARSLTGGTFIG